MAETRKPKDAGGTFPAYLIKFEDQPSLNGRQRVETFINGHAVLDRISLIQVRPGDFARFDEKSKTVVPLITPEAMADFAEFWRKRGAKVEKVSEQAAAAYRVKLEKNPTGHLKPPKKEAPAPQTDKEVETKAQPDHDGPKVADKGKKAPEAPPHKQEAKKRG
jgi:hypothetical protein